MTALCLATPNHAGLIVDFMHKLGEFQKMSSAITVTTEKMEKLLQNKDGEAVLAFADGTPVAFAYFCKLQFRLLSGIPAFILTPFMLRKSSENKALADKSCNFLQNSAKNGAMPVWNGGVLTGTPMHGIFTQI